MLISSITSYLQVPARMVVLKSWEAARVTVYDPRDFVSVRSSLLPAYIMY
jgi:hypothetical protein